MGRYVLAGLFALVGILMIRTALRAKRKIRDSVRWPSVTGRIGEIGIETKERIGSGRRHFQVSLAYEYEVGGKVYTGDARRIRFSQGNLLPSMAAAQARVDEVKRKSPFVVYYDPSAPAESVLFLETSSAATKILVAGVVSLAFGAVMFLAQR